VVGRRWYLLAYDAERADWRTFRIDRIDNAQSTGIRVPPRQPPADDPAEFVTTRLNDLAPVFRATVTLALPASQAATRLGRDFTVHEPVALVDHLRQLGSRLGRAISPGRCSGQADGTRASASAARGRSRQDLDVSVSATHADPLPIPDQPGRPLHAHDGGQPVFPGDDRAMGHEAAHLGHQTRDRHEQG
jgi:hypothetical protein